MKKAVVSRAWGPFFHQFLLRLLCFRFTLESVMHNNNKNERLDFTCKQCAGYNRWSKISQIFRLCHVQTRTEFYKHKHWLHALKFLKSVGPFIKVELNYRTIPTSITQSLYTQSSVKNQCICATQSIVGAFYSSLSCSLPSNHLDALTV